LVGTQVELDSVFFRDNFFPHWRDRFLRDTLMRFRSEGMGEERKGRKILLQGFVDPSRKVELRRVVLFHSPQELSLPLFLPAETLKRIF